MKNGAPAAMTDLRGVVMAIDAGQVLVGLVTAAVTFVGTYLTTYVVWRKNLLVEYDKDLRAKRIEVYRELWKQLQPLAKYARPVRVTPAVLVALSVGLRRWYFVNGGLFLSGSSRDAYFALQDGLREKFKKYTNKELVVVEDWVEEYELSPLSSQPAVVVVASPPELIERWQQELKEEDHIALRHLGSDLRTQMANDVKTRKPSQVRD
ncbi:MAG: hypothetical protein ACJ74W_17440 [Pyrinomonadaceae bacterium]